MIRNKTSTYKTDKSRETMMDRLEKKHFNHQNVMYFKFVHEKQWMSINTIIFTLNIIMNSKHLILNLSKTTEIRAKNGKRKTYFRFFLHAFFLPPVARLLCIESREMPASTTITDPLIRWMNAGERRKRRWILCNGMWVGEAYTYPYLQVVELRRDGTSLLSVYEMCTSIISIREDETLILAAEGMFVIGDLNQPIMDDDDWV